MLLLDLVESAHLQPRAAHGFVAWQAVGEMAVYESFKVKTELVVQVLFDATAPDERPEPVQRDR